MDAALPTNMIRRTAFVPACEAFALVCSMVSAAHLTGAIWRMGDETAPRTAIYAAGPPSAWQWSRWSGVNAGADAVARRARGQNRKPEIDTADGIFLTDPV
jgi:hypothetical protein